MDGFVFYQEYYEALKELPDKSKLRVFEAVMNYAFRGVETKLSGIEKAIYSLIKVQLDTKKRNVENGKKGGAPRGNKNAKKTTSLVLEETTEKQPPLFSENNPPCFNETTPLVLREKEIPIKETPNKEKARQKEIKTQENIYTQEKEKDPPISPQEGGGRSDGRSDVDKAQKEFFVLYPKIRIDNYSPSEYAGIDFELLIQRFKESEFLRGTHSFAFICKNYPKIVAGAYKDFDSRGAGQESKLGSEWNELD